MEIYVPPWVAQVFQEIKTTLLDLCFQQHGHTFYNFTFTDLSKTSRVLNFDMTLSSLWQPLKRIWMEYWDLQKTTLEWKANHQQDLEGQEEGWLRRLSGLLKVAEGVNKIFSFF